MKAKKVVIHFILQNSSQKFFLSVCSSLRFVVSIVAQVMIDGFDVLVIVKSQITQSGTVVVVRDGG